MKDHEKSLELLDKFLAETPKEELEEIFSKIEAMDIEGPTVSEYFNKLV